MISIYLFNSVIFKRSLSKQHKNNIKKVQPRSQLFPNVVQESQQRPTIFLCVQRGAPPTRRGTDAAKKNLFYLISLSVAPERVRVLAIPTPNTCVITVNLYLSKREIYLERWPFDFLLQHQ